MASEWLMADLRAIESRDPDGGEREPTDADHAAHQAWAVAAYGQATWDVYRRGGWDAASYGGRPE